MADMFDPATIAAVQEANRLKIEGIEKISATVESKNGWMTMFVRAMGALAQARHGEKMLGEGIRVALLAAGLSHPLHANAWGAAITAARRRNMIAETGEWHKMMSPGSHARRSPEYVLLPPDRWTSK